MEMIKNKSMKIIIIIMINITFMSNEFIWIYNNEKK